MEVNEKNIKMMTENVIKRMLKVSEKLGKKTITANDCCDEGLENGLMWLRRNAKLSFNDLKRKAGLTINKKGSSSNGRPKRTTVIKSMKVKKLCNKCDEPFERTTANMFICPSCTQENMRHTETPSRFYNGNEHHW